MTVLGAKESGVDKFDPDYRDESGGNKALKIIIDGSKSVSPRKKGKSASGNVSIREANLLKRNNKLYQQLQQKEHELVQARSQLEELRLEFDRYKRNSLPLPESRQDRLPDEAPILYKDWKQLPENKQKTPLDCLQEVWGKYLELGLLYQDDLRGKNGVDPYLMKSIAEYCSRRKMQSSAIIPSKSQRLAGLHGQIDKKKAYQIKNIASKS